MTEHILQHIGILWGVVSGYTVLVIVFAGFLWKIYWRCDNNCKMVKDMSFRVGRIESRLDPDTPGNRLIMQSQCDGMRTSCALGREKLLGEMREEVHLVNKHIDGHLSGVYEELKVLTKAVTKLTTQLEERTGRRKTDEF